MGNKNNLKQKQNIIFHPISGPILTKKGQKTNSTSANMGWITNIKQFLKMEHLDRKKNPLEF